MPRHVGCVAIALEREAEALPNAGEKQEQTMKTLLSSILLSVALLSFGTAQAAPISARTFPQDTYICQIKDGCGVGFHRLSDGSCRPQAKGPALMRLFARKCPLGYRRNLAGKCRKE
jgi:hypothetical protein